MRNSENRPENRSENRSENRKSADSLNTTIRHKLFPFFAGGILLILLLFAVLEFFFNFREYRSRSLRFSENVVNTVTDHVEDADRALALIARSEKRFENFSEVARLPEVVYSTYRYFQKIAIVEENGDIIASYPWRPGVRNATPFLQRGHNHAGLTCRISDPYVSPESGKVTLNMSIRTLEGRYILGELNLQFLQTTIKEMVEAGTVSRLVFLTDGYGNVIAHPDRKYVEQQINIGGNPLFEHIGESEEPLDEVRLVTLFGTRYFAQAHYIPSTKWVLVNAIGIPSLLVLLIRSMFIVAALLVLLLASMGLYMRRVMAKVVINPLTYFLHIVERSVWEDVPLSIDDDVATFQEFQVIQKAFNVMTSKIRERDAELRTYLKAIQEAGFAIYITDSEGRIEYVNPAFTSITGYTEDEVRGRSPRILNSGKQEEDYYDNLWGTILDGRVWEEELVNRRKNGTEYYAHQTIAPIYDSGGDIYHFVAIQMDISERKKAEEELRLSKEKAEEANRIKSDFLANISHEIRTPMNSVLGYAQLLSRHLHEASLLTYVSSIEKSGNMLLALINDILDMSKIEAGRLQLEYEPVTVEPFLDDIRRVFDFRSQEKGIDFVMRIDSSVPDRLLLDEVRLRQVLLNLIGNAMKFTEDGEVRVEVSADEGKGQSGREGTVRLRIDVSDTGIGIPEYDRERIFEAFRQKEGQSNRKYGGTGLGLAISRRLIKAMNGSMELESELDVGSTFRLSLPDVRKAGEAAEDGQDLSSKGEEIEGAAVRFTDVSAVITDDDEDGRRVTADWLREIGLSVEEAADGEAALQQLEEELPDVLILNTGLPDLSVHDVLARMREIERGAELPVILLSALTEEEIKEQFAGEDVLGTLRKPIEFDRLVEMLSKAVSPANKTYAKKAEGKTLAHGSTASGAGVGRPPYSDSAGPSDVRDPEEMVRALEEDLVPKWNEVRSTMFVDDLQDFAERLLELSDTHAHKELRSYAESLIRAAESFDIELLTRLTEDFGGTAEKIRAEISG